MIDLAVFEISACNTPNSSQLETHRNNFTTLSRCLPSGDHYDLTLRGSLHHQLVSYVCRGGLGCVRLLALITTHHSLLFATTPQYSLLFVAATIHHSIDPRSTVEIILRKKKNGGDWSKLIWSSSRVSNFQSHEQNHKNSWFHSGPTCAVGGNHQQFSIKNYSAVTIECAIPN